MEKGEKVNVLGEELEVLHMYGEGSTSLGFLDKVGSARLSKKRGLNPRDKIIGDLKAMGKTHKQIAGVMHGREPTLGEAAYVGLVTRDPKVMNYTAEQYTELVQESKDRLVGALDMATQNFVEAVEGGDLRASTTLLKSVGSLAGTKPDKSPSLEEVQKFGDWLMSERRVIDISDPTAGVVSPRVTTNDPSSIDMPTDGERLDMRIQQPK